MLKLSTDAKLVTCINLVNKKLNHDCINCISGQFETIIMFQKGIFIFAHV